MIYLILGIIAFVLIYEARNKSEEVSGSKHFHLSHGASRDIYLKMSGDGMNEDGLKRFVLMEDRLLQIEKMSVCSGLPNIVEATTLSNMIKEIFPKYNFAYHTIHLKQIAEPLKIVNTRVTC
jgi:hypothetical protein